MAANEATIELLEKELIGLVKTLPTFLKKTYSIFTLEDLERLAVGQAQNLPLVGVGYNGSAPAQGNEVDAKSHGSHSVLLIDLQFVICFAVSFSQPGQEDNKPTATNLMGEVRQKVLGYRKVNDRVWRFMGERPEPEASGDGIIFYSQTWHTAVVVKGTAIYNQT